MSVNHKVNLEQIWLSGEEMGVLEIKRYGEKIETAEYEFATDTLHKE